MIGTPGLALIDGPHVSLTTFRMPPDRVGERKIVSRSRRLDAGRLRGISNACAA